MSPLISSTGREISRELKVPKSTMEYHLRYLKKQELIVTKKVGRYIRYYALQKISRKDEAALSILRNKNPLHIALINLFK